MVAIEAFDAVAVGWAKMLEAPVLEGVVHAVAFIAGAVVAVPMVVVDVGSGVDVARNMPLGFGPGARIVPLRRRWRDAALIGARRILPPLLASLPFAPLANSGKSYENCQSN
jgi:hypothetical protein